MKRDEMKSKVDEVTKVSCSRTEIEALKRISKR